MSSAAWPPRLPIYSTFFLIVVLSSLGLPLLNGFVGEFLIIVGSYYSHASYAAFASAGVVLAAVYLLWMYQRVFYGEINNEKNRTLPDCDFREKLILATMVIVIIAMGVYPQPFLRRMDRTVDSIMLRISKHSLILRSAPPPAAHCLLPTTRRGWPMTTFNTLDMVRILPEITLSGFAVLIMVLEPFVGAAHKKMLGWMALLGICSRGRRRCPP